MITATMERRYMIVSYDDSYDTKTFAFMGSSIIRAIDDTDTKEYMLAGGLGGGIGSIVYQEAGDDTLTFYSYNHKGDVHSLIDENENIAALYEYDAFGNILTSAIDDNSTNSFSFSTREFSELSGLGHWPVREYDQFIGRWTTPDPAEDKDGLNLYRFVSNNPYNFIDMLGDFLGQRYVNDVLEPAPLRLSREPVGADMLKSIMRQNRISSEMLAPVHFLNEFLIGAEDYYICYIKCIAENQIPLLDFDKTVGMIENAMIKKAGSDPETYVRLNYYYVKFRRHDKGGFLGLFKKKGVKICFTDPLTDGALWKRSAKAAKAFGKVSGWVGWFFTYKMAYDCYCECKHLLDD